MPDSGKNGDVAPWGKVASIGLEIAIAVGFGAWIGSWIDGKYKTDPWGLVIGSGVGFIVGMYMLIKQAIAMNKNDGDK